VKPKNAKNAGIVSRLVGYRSVMGPHFDTAPGPAPVLMRPCINVTMINIIENYTGWPKK